MQNTEHVTNRTFCYSEGEYKMVIAKKATCNVLVLGKSNRCEARKSEEPTNIQSTAFL